LAFDWPGAFWRRETAPRAAVFVDVADYLLAAREAMKKARRSIHFLNWAFEADTPFAPEPGGFSEESGRVGGFLKDLAAAKPEVDVRILCWDSAFPIAATQNFFPIQDRRTFHGTQVKFVLDSKVPFGSCHHQKAIVIDDAVAFCGGADIGPDRWDTPLHLDDDPRRIKTPGEGRFFDSRHEVMALVDGPAARALGALFRQRWQRCTGEALPHPEPPLSPKAWPDAVAPQMRGIEVGIARTAPSWRHEPGVREIERLTLASISAARRTIYMENQYFTSPLVAEALAARLVEPEGPEVVLVSTQHSPSYFDQLTMDRTRSQFIQRLRGVDAYGRFRAYSPTTALGRIIIVHAKVAIIDDTLLRIGSANMNNRSTGFDTECDLAFQAEGENRAFVAALRTRLVAHWLGCAPAEVEAAVATEGGSLGRAIEAMRMAGRVRLRPLPSPDLGLAAGLIAAFHLGDPVTPRDSWRPWNRHAQLRHDISRLQDYWRPPTDAAPQMD
jgi:phosphatidylserine/phosphatidylglycerophosphate/cardiolipin synthase-like enzyme